MQQSNFQSVQRNQFLSKLSNLERTYKDLSKKNPDAVFMSVYLNDAMQAIVTEMQRENRTLTPFHKHHLMALYDRLTLNPLSSAHSKGPLATSMKSSFHPSFGDSPPRRPQHLSIPQTSNFSELRTNSTIGSVDTVHFNQIFDDHFKAYESELRGEVARRNNKDLASKQKELIAENERLTKLLKCVLAETSELKKSRDSVHEGIGKSHHDMNQRLETLNQELNFRLEDSDRCKRAIEEMIRKNDSMERKHAKLEKKWKRKIMELLDRNKELESHHKRQEEVNAELKGELNANKIFQAFRAEHDNLKTMPVVDQDRTKQQSMTAVVEDVIASMTDADRVGGSIDSSIDQDKSEDNGIDITKKYKILKKKYSRALQFIATKLGV